MFRTAVSLRFSPHPWILRIVSLTLMLALARPASATETFSLVIGGRLHDVETLQDLSLGRLVSAALLNVVASTDGKISVDTRPDRGHIVIATGAEQPVNKPIRGFKTARITFILDGTPITAQGKLVSGVPFLPIDTLETILTAMKFNVLYSVDSRLIALNRVGDQSGSGAGASSSGERGSVGAGGQAPGGDMMEAVQQGVAGALQQMGGVSGVHTLPGSYSAGGGVCGAMDELRSLWEATEPNALEKATFRALADKFQEAKDNQGTLEPADVDNMVKTLARFRTKVDRRLEGTRAWNAPPETGRVKSYGVSFLESFSQAMDLAQEMMKAIQEQDESFVDRAEDMIETLKGLEQTIQAQGTRFDKEVIRVRQTYGCGPARSGVPPS